MNNIPGNVTPADSLKITTTLSPSCDSFVSNQEAASYWFNFGFKVIPIRPGTKQTAVKWNPWLEDLSIKKIANYWTSNPKHELGFIVGDDIIVFDADSPESIVALAQIEKALDLMPSLVVKTRKGEHHLYRRAKNTFAKSDSHDTKQYPDRIDVKTGRAMVILPPSTGKVIEISEAGSANELAEIGQDVIDAIFRHNGRSAPRLQEIVPLNPVHTKTGSQILVRLSVLTDHLDPDCGYDDWTHVLMAIHNETGGNEEGFELADAWSGKGKKYKGSRQIRNKWNSFKSGHDNHYTIGTLINMVEANGVDWISVCSIAEDGDFEDGEFEDVEPSKPSTNPLDKYSLRGQLKEVEKNAVKAIPLLGQFSLSGQSTIIYSPPNTGKTLITLSELIEAIKNRRVDPSKVYYLNMDDTGDGLLEKLHVAEEYGFNMLVEGYQDFTASVLLSIIRDLVESDQARGIVIILDTLKKFVDLMDKTRSSNFSKTIRQFIVSGGSLIALAHTNKNLGSNGKPQYGGTTDIIDDSDCAYILNTVSKDSSKKVVIFENIKRRGNVVQTVAYSYSTDHTMSYTEILLSVENVDECQLAPLKQAEQLNADAEIITAVETCIKNGINTKMKLADAVAKQAGVSKRNALNIIEKYTGVTPSQYKWHYTVGDRGANLFYLLATQSET